MIPSRSKPAQAPTLRASPVRASSAVRRRQILDAARDAWLEEGGFSLRMADIASRARVSKGTLYNHFESKEDLLLAVVEDRLQLGTELVERTVGTAIEPRLALERTIDGLVQVIGVQSTSAPVLYQAWAVVTGNPELTRRLHDALRSFFRHWAASARSILEAGQASGAFRADVDIEPFVQSVLALVSGFIFRGVFEPEATRPEALQAAFDALFSCSLLAPKERLSGEPRR